MSTGKVKVVWAAPRCRQMLLDVKGEIPGYRGKGEREGEPRSTAAQKPVTVHIHTVRPRLQRKPQGWRARGAASTSRTAGGASTVTSAAGAVAAAKPRSRPGQLAVEELQARAGSQWALLAAADARTLALEEEMRKKELRRRQQQCLADLNAQMAAKAALAAAEADAKRQERAAIAAEVARNEAEQQRLAAERRAAMSSVKFDRQRQVKEFRASKRILERLRRKQEQRELADSEAALQAEKATQQLAQVRERDAMRASMLANEERMRAKELAELAEAEEDAAAAAQYQELLAAQDAERQAALQEMYAKSATRAVQAGKQGVKEARERAEREEQLIRQYEEQQAERLAAAAAEKRLRAGRVKADIEQSRAQQRALKADRAAAEAAEAAKHLAAMRLSIDRGAAADATRASAARQGALDIRRVQELQIEDQENAFVVAEARMVGAERRFNASALNQAAVSARPAPMSKPRRR